MRDGTAGKRAPRNDRERGAGWQRMMERPHDSDSPTSVEAEEEDGGTWRAGRDRDRIGRGAGPGTADRRAVVRRVEERAGVVVAGTDLVRAEGEVVDDEATTAERLAGRDL